MRKHKDWIDFRTRAIEAYNTLPTSGADSRSGEDVLSKLPTFGRFNFWNLTKGIPRKSENPEAYIKLASEQLATGWKEQLGSPPEDEAYYVGITDGKPMMFIEKRFPSATIRLQYYIHFSLRNKTATAYPRGALYHEKPTKMAPWLKTAIFIALTLCLFFPSLIILFAFFFGALFLASRLHPWEGEFIKVSPRDSDVSNPLEKLAGFELRHWETELRPWLDENFHDLETVAHKILFGDPDAQGVDRRPPPLLDSPSDSADHAVLGQADSSKRKKSVPLKIPALGALAGVLCMILVSQIDGCGESEDPPHAAQTDDQDEKVVPQEGETVLGQHSIVGAYVKPVDIPPNEIVKTTNGRMILHFESDVSNDLKLIIRDDIQRSVRTTVGLHPLLRRTLNAPDQPIEVDGVEVPKKIISEELIAAYERVEKVETDGVRESLRPFADKLLEAAKGAERDEPSFGPEGANKPPLRWNAYAKAAYQKNGHDRSRATLVKLYEEFIDSELRGFDKNLVVAEMKRHKGKRFLALRDFWKEWVKLSSQDLGPPLEAHDWSISGPGYAEVRKREIMNYIFSSKSIYVPECLLDFEPVSIDVEGRGKQSGWYTKLMTEDMQANDSLLTSMEFHVFTLDGEWRILARQKLRSEENDPADLPRYPR